MITIQNPMSSPEQEMEYLKANLNQEFRIVTVFWITFMQAGFAFIEAGSVRSKNTTNILFKNVLDMFISALAYWSFGYAFAYGKPGNGFIGYNYFFASHLNLRIDNLQGNNSSHSTSRDEAAGEYFSSFMSSYGYAAAASTILSGAVAERVRISAYLIYSIVITGFVYPIVSHWVWDENGWLHSATDVTFVDFAGSAAVHITGGTAALVAAVIIGPRIGRFPTSDEVQPNTNQMRGHSIPLVCIGGFMLFIGFLAFNASSQHHITEPEDGMRVSLTVVNTLLAASSSALSATVMNALFDYWQTKVSHWSLLTLVNGYLSGLVAVCAGSNQMMNWAALLTGLLAGIFTIIWQRILLRLRIDDPVNTIPVHLGGGLTGSLTAPILILDGQKLNGKFVGGIIYGGGAPAWKGFAWNVAGTLSIMAWSGSLSFILFIAMKKFGILRVTADHEKTGLDLVHHGEPAYPKSDRLPIRKMINYDF